MIPEKMQLEPQVMACALGAKVRTNFEAAHTAKSNEITPRLLKCLEQRSYSDDECKAHNEGLATSLTSTKCRAAVSWLWDVVQAAKNEYFVIQPTPLPDVSDAAKSQVTAELVKYIRAVFGDEADSSDRAIRAVVRERAPEVYDSYQASVKDKARKAAMRMETKIRDQLTESGFDAEFKGFIDDLCTYPFAVMRGGVVQQSRDMAWGPSGQPEVRDIVRVGARRVSPFDFYWAPWSKVTGQGYEMEVIRYLPYQLHAMIDTDPYVDKIKMQYVVDTYPDGFEVYVNHRQERDDAETAGTNYSVNKIGTIEVLDYWDIIHGADLQEWGVRDIEAAKFYAVNLWVVDSVCVRAVLNPDPLGLNPFYMASYEAIPGSRVGKAIPELIRLHQEIINSSYRALRRNMGLASGPIGEYDASRILEGQDPVDLFPLKMTATKPDPYSGGSQGPAYRFYDIKSHAQELMGIIERETKNADDACGIPAYSYGNAAATGAGRTVGGLALLMGNASKGIKQVATTMDINIIAPLIQQMYRYNALTEYDPGLVGDIKIVARGLSGIITKEAEQQRAIQGMQMFMPLVQSQVISNEGAAELARDALEAFGYDADKFIPDPKQAGRLKALVDAKAKVKPKAPTQPPAGLLQQLQRPNPAQAGLVASPQANVRLQNPSPLQGAIPQPVLDGRSGPAQQILENLNAAR
jgi:hypothetical protein